MKNDVMYMIVQPGTDKTFWIGNIKQGIFDTAKHLQCVPCILNLDGGEALPHLSKAPVLVVGNDDDWLNRVLELLNCLGARGIIVNGSMQDSEFHTCSGVTFELEEAIRYTLEKLQAAGRKRIAFLGANPQSVSDLCKCKAFDDPENIIWVHGELETCVLNFIRTFRQEGYDAVICANDTVAIYLVRNLLGQGLHLPEDLFVIGMGNSYIGSTLPLPLPLTSIDFNYYQMGQTAVKLYGFLKENENCGHIVSHLPCRLIIRASAPLEECPNSVFSVAEPQEISLKFFNGKDTQNIIKVESILQTGDEIDRQIVLGLLNGKSSETIAESIFLSTRAVRYRITNLVKKHDFPDRETLIAALNNAIGINEIEEEA